MTSPRGMSLIDVVIGTALIVIVFMALFGLLHASLQISTMVKNESTASAIANNQMEYIRSLPYSSVGTEKGIPSGSIVQNTTVVEDNSSYAVRTFIDYYDDPADGTGASDTDGITTDYKRIKVTVTYATSPNHTQQIILNSNYAPVGLETTSGGGTLQIIVVNAVGAPVSGASVHVVNSTASPAVDLTTFTDSTGIVYLPGAPAAINYAITVSKAGYSTAQTYARDSTNQNPTPGYLTVVQNLTTSSTFAIDTLGLLTLQTFSPVTSGSFTDTFTDSSKLTTITNVTATGGSLTLSGGAGAYALSGSASSVATTPTSISSWASASATMTQPNGTTAVVHVLDGSGALLPDAVLAGNSAGFSTFPINLTSVSTTTYPTLALSTNLATNSKNTTPSLTGWTLTYQSNPTPLPNVSYSFTGLKTTGSTGTGAPIYKTTVNGITGSTGIAALSLEWDSYALSISGFDVQDACEAPPYALSPSANITESLTLIPATSNSLLISVNDATGNSVSGASVTLSRSGYTKTVTSSSCGAAYFGSLTAANDYSVTIAKTGYPTTTTSGVVASGHTFYATAF